MAIDPTTIAVAFRKFSEDTNISLDHLRPTETSASLFEGLAGYSDADFDIHDVVADAGGEEKREGMNNLAEEHGFDEPFTKPFSENEIGVLSIVDKNMKWHAGDAEKVNVLVRNGEVRKLFEGVRFDLTSENDEHFAVFDVNGFSKPVVRIAADPEKSDGVQNFMWVTEISSEENPSLIDLFQGVKNTVNVIAQKDADIKRRGAAEVASVTMPKLSDVKYERDWKELTGTTLGQDNEWLVTEAKQVVRVSIDEIGAEAAAMFRLGALTIGGGGGFDPREQIVIGDKGPMLVWFTEGESRLPICATVTNQEAWAPWDPEK